MVTGYAGDLIRQQVYELPIVREREENHNMGISGNFSNGGGIGQAGPPGAQLFAKADKAGIGGQEGDNKIGKAEVEKIYNEAQGKDKEDLKKVLDGFDKKQVKDGTPEGTLDLNAFTSLIA